MVGILGLEALKLLLVGRSLLQLDVVIIFAIIAIFVHVHALKIRDLDRTASEIAEHCCALASDHFEDLNPHLLREINGEKYRWDENEQEDDPGHDLTFHDGLAFASLIVETGIDRQDDDKEGERLHCVQFCVIVRL